MMMIGMIVIKKPVNTYIKPSPSTTVSQKCAPALTPTLARNSTKPISRSIILADVVVYVLSFMRCPNRPMRIAMISGPPAIPSFIGTGMPGIAKGMLPKRIPTMIPMKIVAMLGVSRRLTELPIKSAMRFTLSVGPTTSILSPTWKR